MDGNLLLLLHSALTWALVGLIWTIQLVQYPGFLHVGEKEFATFHEQHCSRITWIVAPLMGGELLTGLALLYDPPPGVAPSLFWTGLALIGINAAATALVFVPLHSRASARDQATLRAMVNTNWVRTFCWSARGALVLVALRAI